MNNLKHLYHQEYVIFVNKKPVMYPNNMNYRSAKIRLSRCLKTPFFNAIQVILLRPISLNAFYKYVYSGHH